jgi:hypothetical protein
MLSAFAHGVGLLTASPCVPSLSQTLGSGDELLVWPWAVLGPYGSRRVPVMRPLGWLGILRGFARSCLSGLLVPRCNPELAILAT